MKRARTDRGKIYRAGALGSGGRNKYDMTSSQGRAWKKKHPKKKEGHQAKRVSRWCADNIEGEGTGDNEKNNYSGVPKGGEMHVH